MTAIQHPIINIGEYKDIALDKLKLWKKFNITYALSKYNDLQINDVVHL